MLRKNIFALASILALGAGVAACGDKEKDENPDKEVEIPEGATVYSYLAGITLPDENDTCCADLSDDGEIDNALGELLPMVGSLAGDDFDLDELIGGVFEDGSLTLLFEYKNVPKKKGEGDLAIFMGESDSSAADRMSGKGVFTKTGAAVTTSKFGVDGSTYSVNADSLALKIDLSSFGESVTELGLSTIELPLSPAKLLLDVKGENGGIATSSATAKLGKPINYLTGGVSIHVVTGVLNQVLSTCDGAGDNYLSYNEEEGTLEMNGEITGGGGICDDVGGILDVAGDLLGEFLDLDTNGNGFGDAISLGVRVKLVAAEVK